MIVIKGEKIILKTFERHEYHVFYKKYVADPIMDPNQYVYNKEKVDKSFNAIKEKETYYPIVGIFLPNSEVIGELSFKRINYEKSQCELGIVLANNEYKGLGYGTEAVHLAIEYAFNTLKLNNILVDTMGSNIKMRRILNKLGFDLISKEHNYYDMGNRKEDKLNYILLNPNNWAK